MAKEEDDQREKSEPKGLRLTTSNAHEIREPIQLLAKLIECSFQLLRTALCVVAVGAVGLAFKITLATITLTIAILAMCTAMAFLAFGRRKLLKDEHYVESEKLCAQSHAYLLPPHQPFSIRSTLTLGPSASDNQPPQLPSPIDWSVCRVYLNRQFNDAKQVLSALGEANVPIASLFGHKEPEAVIVSYGSQVPVSHVNALKRLLEDAGCDCSYRRDEENSTLSMRIYIGSYACTG